MFLNNKILLVVTKTERILLFRTSSCLNFSKNNDMRDKCDSYLITSEMFPVPRSTPCHSCLVQYVNIANYAFSCAMELNPRTYTQSHTAPRPTHPALGFLICSNISKRFCLQQKAFDLLQKVRYILLVVALLELCDVTQHGRHLGRHLGFCKELETSKNSEN